MSLASGQRLGSYTIVSSIGAGGMGEVYRARDLTLDRDVAIKVLPESFALDADRIARFSREAKALAALNHPNIAAIYGVADDASVRALVMELVEGEDLSAVIARGTTPVPEALAIARQIADALAAAHDAGIVHRDLKPANVKLRPDGAVKVLDFGLAKAVDPAGSSPESQANSPTLTARGTRMGMIIGTAAYMAPEQARGRAVDQRADIWALGVILYELLTGRRAFAGDDISITLASVLKDDLDWRALPAGTPPALVRLLRRCLAKDPKARLRDAADVRLEIDEILADPGGADARPAAITPPRRRTGAWLAAAAAIAIVAAAIAASIAWWLRPAAAPLPLRKFVVAAPGNAAISLAAIAPDGRAIAFVSDDKLRIRRLDSLEVLTIDGTSELHDVFWSPDSASVGFQSKSQLWKVAASGGAPMSICRVPREFSAAGGAAWLDGDRIVFTTGGSGLMEVSALGGQPKSLFDPDLAVEADFHRVSPLPGGRGLMFIPHPVNQAQKRVDLVTGASRKTIFELPEGGQIHEVVYSPSGHLLYSTNDGVWAVPFALDRLAATGAPFRVAAARALPSVASDGTLAVVDSGTAIENQQPVWVNAKGEVVETVGPKGSPLFDPRLSPDGRQLVAARGPTRGTSDLWILDLARHTERRLTYESGLNAYPAWSHDGKTIVYECARGICSRPADGTGQPLVLVPEPAARPELSPDDRHLLFAREQTVTTLDLFHVPLGAGPAAPPTGPPAPFVAAERMQYVGAPSPNGRFAAYWSNETGLSTIYLTEWPAGQGKWQIGQGQQPRWSAKGDRLYYVLGDNIAEVTVTTSPGLSFSQPKPMLATTAGISVPGYGFEVSADGARFLVNRASAGANAGVLIVEHWAAEFAPRTAR